MTSSLLLSWEKSFETGLELIDNQHKELIGVINIYHVQCGITPNAKKALHTLTEMKRLCEPHFRHEELIQTSCNYPDFGAHQTAHNSLMFEIRRWVMAMEEKDVSLTTLFECHDFILYSIVSHLQEHDTPFFTYYREYCILHPHN